MASTVDLGARLLADVELPERYSVRRRIASGGMGSVWCAEDRLLGRTVAIKLVCEPLAAGETSIRRFKREARAAARLSGHRHVVTIFDVGEVAGAEGSVRCAFIVMEFLAGGTAADALRVGAADAPTALRWISEAASAIDFAHQHGVIHRDLKLANFLLDGDRILKVADFGIAQLGAEDTLTGSGEMLGTAAYLAPERAVGQLATEASDRYSLAVAAYELLVGERPFTSPHFAALVRQAVEEEPPAASLRNPSLPAEVDAVLARGLAKAPQDRWPTASAFAEALAAAMHQPATAAVSPAAPLAAFSPRSRWRAFPRPRARLAALGAMGAAACAGLIVLLAGQPSSPIASAPAGSGTAGSGARSGSARAGVAPAMAGVLESQGHSLMAQGQYRAAIPVLRRAVGDAAPASLTYAYALYDLGRSLRLAGDPQAAIPILERRLQIPNQLGTVRQELALAEQQAAGGSGAAESSSTGAGASAGAGSSAAASSSPAAEPSGGPRRGPSGARGPAAAAASGGASPLPPGPAGDGPPSGRGPDGAGPPGHVGHGRGD